MDLRFATVVVFHLLWPRGSRKVRKGRRFLEKLRMVHIIGSRHSGGAERFFIRLVRSLADMEADVSIIARTGSYVARELAGEMPLHAVPMVNVRDPFSRFLITKALRSIQPQIVQTYMGRATRLTRIPGSSPMVHLARLGGFYKLAGYRHADAWVGNTREIRDYLVKNGFPEDRVFYIRNFVDPEPPAPEETLLEIHRELGIPDDALVIVSAGRFVEKKGFDLLLEAFSLVPLGIGGRPVHLVLVGAGDMEKSLKTLSEKLRVQERVHWSGWQDNPGPYYEMGDLFVCPSHHEPLGNVILEAWNHGVPVLSTASQGAVELIRDHSNGVLVPHKDARAMALGIERLLGRPEESANLVMEGSRSLETAYRSDAVAEEYLRIYRKLLETPPGG